MRDILDGILEFVLKILKLPIEKHWNSRRVKFSTTKLWNKIDFEFLQRIISVRLVFSSGWKLNHELSMKFIASERNQSVVN